MYFKSKKELNYGRFVDPNIRGAVCLVHSDLRIYRISFFLLDTFSKCLVSNLANMSNFRPLEVVSRGSETQLQVAENFNKLILQDKG